MTARSFDPNDFAYTSVVYLAVNFSDYSYQGSGVLISPDEVLTADHMVFNNYDGLGAGVLASHAYGKGVAPFGAIPSAVTHYSAAIVDDPYISYGDFQSDFAVIHLARPVTGAGNMAVTSSFAGGPVHVTGYPGFAGQVMVDDVQSVSADPSYTFWTSTPTGTGSSGGPVWVYGPDGKPQVVGLVSAASVVLNTSNDVQITPAMAAQIAAWVKQDDAGLAEPAPYALPVASLAIYDATAKQALPNTLSTPFTGTLPYLAEQYVSVTSHNLSIVAGSPNYFIHTGDGNDAVQLLGGANVVDAGAGSNFLTAGTGRDTFFLDTRGAASDIWDTVSRFRSGDAATVFGIGPGTASLSWADGQGAAGSTGLTLHASAPGSPKGAAFAAGPTASLTLAGFTTADLAAGRITTAFGSTGGVSYLSAAAA